MTGHEHTSTHLYTYSFSAFRPDFLHHLPAINWKNKSFHVLILCFYYYVFQKDEVYLNLVLEYIPETVYKVARHYSKSKQTIPISFIKVSDYNLLFLL